MLSLDSAPVYTDFDGLAKMKLDAREQSPEALKQVASQFESIFVNMMLKSMRQAKLSEGALDSQQSEFYRDMYDHQIALQLAAKPGLGIADFIVKQLSPKKPAGEASKELGDYLSDATDAGSGALPVQQYQAANLASVNPMFASGLNSLAGVEAIRQSRNDTWQSQDDEWQSEKIGGNQAISSKEDFINQLLPHARQAASALGVDANLLLAQAALETGWGQGVIKNNQGVSSYNLFNIKADKSWQGKQAKTLTLEFDGGVARKEMAGFRSYESYKHSFDDYVSFIKSNPRYSEALKKAANPVQYIHELQQAGYATDPRYAEKIMNIYNAQTADNIKPAKGSG